MIFLMLFLSSSVSAQQDPQKIEVIAPAEPETEPLQIDALKLNTAYKQSTDDSLLEIPNLSFAGGTSRPRYLQIRGVGETSTYENTPSHSVTYLLNDIDLTGILASWPQMNVATLHVDKGPQSTFWGGSSTGGLVRTELQNNSGETSLPNELRAVAQSQGGVQGGVAVNIFSKSRLFLYHVNDPGFYKNTYLSRKVSGQNEYYVSLVNDLFHSENWQISSSHIGMKSQNGYDVWSLNNDLKTISDQPGQDSLLLQGHSLKIRRTISETTSLNSLSSIAVSDSVYSYDADWGNNPYWQSIPGWNANYDYFDEFQRRRTAWHQKLFITHRTSSAGFHFYGLDERTHIDHFKNKNLKSSLGSNYRSRSAALFADLRETFFEKNSLQLATRYEIQNTDYQDSSLTEGDRKDHSFSFQSEWRHHLKESSFVFAKVSSGFKSAGVNVDSSLSPDRRYYDPEKVMNYEVGFQRQSASSLVAFDLFYMDQKQKQVKVSKQDDPMDPSTYTYFTSNAARVATYGLEAQWRKRIGLWQSELQLGLLKAAFKNYEFENHSYDGRNVAHAPTWNYAWSLTQNWSEQFSSNLSFIGKNSFYFSNNHDQTSSTTHLVNGGLTYKKKNWSWNLWVNNIFDRRYEIRGFYFANEPPNWENKLYTQQGLPRRAGLSLSYQF
jgi:iron complex outermembrane receptor protein